MADDRGGDPYEWWSRHPGALDWLYRVAFLGRERAFRRRTLDALAPRPGERVLDVGCGPGDAFGPIRSGVGPDGVVVGLDASPGMVGVARDRIGEVGWQNVHALRGDARRPPVASNSFDAAHAAMSLSAVAAPADAIRAIETALRPGGRLVVLDAQPFDEAWPWQLLNPVVEPLARRTTDWVPEVDLVAALRDTFASVDVETFNGGSILVACARKAESN